MPPSDPETGSDEPELCGSLGCTRPNGHAGLCAIPAPAGKRDSGARQLERAARLREEAERAAELARLEARAAAVGPWTPPAPGAAWAAREPDLLMGRAELRRELSRSGRGSEGAWAWLRRRRALSLEGCDWRHFRDELREELARRACLSRMIAARAGRRARRAQGRRSRRGDAGPH